MASSSSSKGLEVPVFIDTNLGTHIALAIYPSTTYAQFKRELESTHLNCFPNIGEIRTNGLMVKQKSCFYHLPESLPLLHAFKGIKGTWLIHMEACLWSRSNLPDSSKSMATEVSDHNSNGSSVTNSAELEYRVTSNSKNYINYKRKKRRVKRLHYLKSALLNVLRAIHLSKKKKEKWKRIKKNCSVNYTANAVEKGHLGVNVGVTTVERFDILQSTNEGDRCVQWDSSSAVETPSEMSLESVSISGIIKKYFSPYEEVTSGSERMFKSTQSGHKERLKTRSNGNARDIQVDITPKFAAKTPPQMLVYPFSTGYGSETASRNKRKKEVGKRLLVASNNLGISASKQKPSVSLCRRIDENLLMSKSSSLVRSLVFELLDDDN